MDFFHSFQQRALQAVDAAKELASTVSTDALGTAQTLAATITSDAKDMARDAQQKVGAQPKGGSQAADGAEGISDSLLTFVRALSCSSFLDASPCASTSSEASPQPLAAWRVEHATAVLQKSPELESLRFALVPKRLSDEQFWRRYFSLVEHVLGDEDRSGSREHRAQTAASHRTQQTSRSGASAWEDLGQSPGLAPGSSPSACKGQGDAELDDYLKGMLDDGDLPAAASGDDEADDLDDYLHELEAADDEGGGGGAGEAAGEDVAKYLEDLGLDDGDDGATAASPAGAGKSD